MSSIHKLKPFDRRRHKRLVPNYHPIKCNCVYTESGKNIQFPAEIIDASKSGLKLMTNENKIYPNTELTVCFVLPPSEKVLSVHGTIVRTYGVYFAELYYSGVKLDDENEESIRLLLDFILKTHTQEEK